MFLVLFIEYVIDLKFLHRVVIWIYWNVNVHWFQMWQFLFCFVRCLWFVIKIMKILWWISTLISRNIILALYQKIIKKNINWFKPSSDTMMEWHVRHLL